MRWLIVVALSIVLAGSAIAYDENDLHLLDSELWRIENCSECDPRNADLRFVDFSGAYLSGADLRGANLDGVDLSDSYLGNVTLSGAVFCNTAMPDGTVLYSGC